MPYPGRLHHTVPNWVEDGAAFHIRVRSAQDTTWLNGDCAPARAILNATRNYHDNQRWFCRLIVVMPDHVHGIFVFPRSRPMSAVIGAWKGYLARAERINWQQGYFDHRLRNRTEADECWRYIRQNPVRAGLTEHEDGWPWSWWPDDTLVPE